MPARTNPALRASSMWLGFVVVHVWLSYAVLFGPHTPLNDVHTVYRDWVDEGLRGLGWVGLDRVWVYPAAALAPMLIAAVAGIAHYDTVWLLMVAALDAVALGILTRGGTRNLTAGWWWLAFLTALGPIAVGRIDSITIPLAIVALVVAAARPTLAAVLVALGTWIKVWPAALVVALLIAGRSWIRVAAGAAGASVTIVLVALLAGGDLATVLGFVGQQTGRGLQLEAVVTTPWLWLEAFGVPGTVTAFDHTILTYQVTGPGSSVASALSTPVMLVVMVGIALLGLRAVRRRGSSPELLAALALALTTAFIVTNKVGSPQYEGWIAAPVILGVLLRRRIDLAAVVALLIAGATQIVYPWHYDALVLATPWMVVLMTLRNLLLVVLLVVAVRRVWVGGRIDACSSPSVSRPAEEPPRGANPIPSTRP